MRFDPPLEEVVFLKRYKRFFADVRRGDETFVAHVPNTGSLKSCLSENAAALISRSPNPERKLPYTLEFVRTSNSWVGVNTQRSNPLVWEVWEEQRNPLWHQYTAGFREVKINPETRLDMKLTAPNLPDHYIEVKNVTLKNGDFAQFPDAVTTRGQKHLTELMKLIKNGATAEIVFTVQREDCAQFAAADDIDPDYGKLLRKAAKAGVRITVWPTKITAAEVCLEPERKIDFPG